MKQKRLAGWKGRPGRARIGLMLGLALAAGAGGPTRGMADAEAPRETLSAETGRARVLALRREIARHDELYFKKAAPEISDFEYDTLKAELRALEARFPASDESPDPADAAPGIGDDRSGLFGTRPHREPMLSLEKAYSDEEVAAFVARTSARLGRDDVVYRAEPKYDGIAVSLTYERGRLRSATTRGNGVEGDDITANALVVRGVVADLKAAPAAPWPERVELRGEIFVPFAGFARINEERAAAGEEPFANPRNLAAGSIRLQDTAELATRGLEFVCHGWGAWEAGPGGDAGGGGRPATLGGFRSTLAAWGLPAVAETRTARGAAELAAAAKALRDAGEEGGFPTDGVVLKLERVADQAALGVGPSAPRWALARKFAPARAATRLLGITWQAGRTGVLTPVAELVPVALDGSTVARATLHNAEEIARRDLRIGDTVFVEKAGEIIPAVVGVDTTARAADAAPYAAPTACPSCSGEITRREGRAALRCENRACAAQVARRIEHLAAADALDVAGLGPALIENLVTRGLVKTPPDLFRLRAEDLQGLPGVGEKSATALAGRLAAARRRAEADGARLLHGLGWPGVGKETARRLAEAFGGLEALAGADEARLRSEAGLGAMSAQVLADHLASEESIAERAAWAELGIGRSWPRTAAGGPLAREVVVVTGRLSRWTREEATARLTAAGAQVGADVTRRTTLLVAGAEPGEKLAKANARGVEVIDEAELARRLGEP